MPELAFIVTKSTTLPEATKIIERAGELGVHLTALPSLDLFTLEFSLGSGEQLGVRLMDSALPDLSEVPTGPTSAAPEKLLEAPSHLILHIAELHQDEMSARVTMAGITAAVASATDAVAVMIGDGVVFHRAEVFVAMAEAGIATGTPPPLLLVEITVAPEGEDRMSFLTHGLALTGRDEELFVTSPNQGDGALNFIFQTIEELTDNPETTYATGQVVSTEAGVGLVVQRQANPGGDGPPVMRFDLPDEIQPG